ncbi:unnamed protein product, partial [Closterium sp. Naga37s-1]
MSNPVAGTQEAGSTAIAFALKDVSVERIVGPGNDEVVKIGSFWESQPVVIHFLRRFGCRICRGGAMDMSRAIPHLHNAGVRVVAIGLDHLGMDEFIDGGYWKGELYIDDGKRAYRALQLKSISLWQVAYQLLFDKTVKKSLGDTANVKGDLAGDGLQLGATFVFDKGGKLLHDFRQVTVADHPSPEELLKPFGIDTSTPNPPPAAVPDQGPVSLRLPVVRAAAGDAESSGAEKPRGERAKGIFEFVTDNPSSRSAIQLKNAPAMDGNVGQMISVRARDAGAGGEAEKGRAGGSEEYVEAFQWKAGAIEDKGKDMGSYLLSGEFQYFVRQIGNTGDPLVVYLHGAPAQSWGFREVMQQMAEKGYRGIAPDWLGFGFSEKPQPGYYFAYTEDAYHQEMDRLLETLNVTEPFYLVVHGYLVGSYGLTWALKNCSRLKGLAILNTPLSPSSPLPQIFQQLRLPFVGEFQCQNAVLAERFIEKGSPYSLELDNADVYRLPYLDSGEPGFSLLETARKANPKQLGERIQNALSSSSWTVPTVIAWGKDDPYIPITEAQAIAKTNSSSVTLRVLEGAGHTPQED